MRHILTLDLETTGLDPRNNEIMQVGAILSDSSFRNELLMFSSLCRVYFPERGVTKDFNAFKFAGIHAEDVIGKEVKRPDAVLYELVQSVRTITGDSEVLVFGQNIKFDLNFIDQNYSNWPFDYHSLSLESMYSTWYFLQYGQLPERMSLKAICKELQINNNTPHNALSDCVATLQCARNILWSRINV
jgi:CRISPR-associated protein Cas2